MSTTFPRDPRATEWGTPDLPEWVTSFRPTQVEAVQQILARFEAGARVVVLDAPTGSGKTLIGETVRRLLTVKQATYICSDRGLQAQFLRDFKYAKVLMGRRNYPTLDYPERFQSDEHLSCDDCTRTAAKPRCQWCAETRACPYRVAKSQALGAPIACVNTAYFLAEANGPGGFGDEDLVVVDECDRLEETLMSHVAVNVTGRRLIEWGLQPLPKDATVAQAADWIEQSVLPRVEEDIARLGTPADDDVRGARRLRALRNLEYRLSEILEGLDGGEWVWTPYPGDPPGTAFKPVRVNHVAGPLLWAHSEKWLLMSATVLNPARMLKDLGIIEDWAVVRMPSPFPVSNRPIFAKSVASVTRNEEETAAPKLIAAIQGIMALHPKERILVHTVSFRLLNRLKQALGADRRTVWYAGADSRADVLADYLARPAGVLFAPAMDRGVDLPDDACRVVVVVKMPFGDLGDAQIRARMNGPGGRDWYSDNTLRSLVQMTGRGVRHAEDYCVSYILDSQFDRMFAQYRSRLPGWWVEAVK